MFSISKDVYINRLDYIIDKYNNTYHRTIKMKPTDAKTSAYINVALKISIKIIN